MPDPAFAPAFAEASADKKGSADKPANAVRWSAFAHPFDRRRADNAFPEGLTIAEMLLASGFAEREWPHLKVFAGDHEIPRANWRRARPKAGAPMLAVAMPGRRGGGILAVIATIAIIAFAAWAAPAIASSVGLVGAEGAGAAFVAGSTGAKIATGLIGGVITAVGGLITSALIPPPSPSAPAAFGGFGGATSLSSPTYQITGVQNRLNPYGPIPRVFGERRIFPVLGARAYTETLGDKRYFRVLLVAGYGPLSLDEVRIGNTPIEAFSNVEIEIREGWPDDAPRALFTRRISETQLTVALTQAAGWRTQRTESNVVSGSLDIAFERGLAYYNAGGGTDARTVTFEAEYRLASSSGAWSPIAWDSGSDEGFSTSGLISISANSTSAVRRGGRFTFPAAGEYDVRIRRTTADTTDSRSVTQSTWTALRSIRNENPVNMPGLATIALRIEAYEQLNNQLQEISCRARSWHRVWNGAAWTWQRTRVPAWHCVDLLTRRGTKTLLPDSRIDAVGFKAWADAGAARAAADLPEWNFDGVIEGGNVAEAFATIAAHGRARPGFSPDGKYSVVRDVPQSVPALHITPRNSFGYRGRRDLRDLPHALRVRFSDPAIDYQENERIVCADGWTEETAEEFDTLDLYGATDPDLAWAEGRYHLAVLRLRRETHEVFQDVEALRATDGDLVMFAHDVIAVGLSQGRIAARITSGANTIGFELDEEIVMETGGSYALRVRRKDGASQVLTLATAAGASKTATLASPLATSLAPEAGDLFLFGEAGLESMPAIVKAIEPGPDLTAKIVLLPAAPEVHDADTGTIPAFESFATPLPLATPQPVGLFLAASTPELRMMADGTQRPRIRVRWNLPSATATLGGVDVEIQWRQVASPESAWSPSAFTSGGAPEFWIGDVIETRADAPSFYEVRIRTLARLSSVRSDWLGQTVEVLGKTAPPSDVTGFSATQNGTRVNFRADQIADVDLDRIEIRRAPLGSTDFAAAIRTANLLRGESLVSEIVPPGEWTFLARAFDASQNPSANVARFDLTVRNPNTVVAQRASAPDWPGTRTGLILHPSGVLVPDSTMAAADMTDAELWDEFVHSPVSVCRYECPEIDLGFDVGVDQRVRCYAAISAALGPGEAGTPVAGLEIDTREEAGVYDGFEPWSAGAIHGRRIKARVTLDPSLGVAVLAGFDPTIDAEARRETRQGVAVGASGTPVNFAQRFFGPPVVTVQPVGTTARIGQPSAIGPTGCTAHLFDTAGAGVTGTADVIAEGV